MIVDALLVAQVLEHVTQAGEHVTRMFLEDVTTVVQPMLDFGEGVQNAGCQER
ncbi:hypothetical protein [Longispora albida]|uniref:hypothetical protein n=1 Tax=Longispora albida TaxID=203523 RepID=UPI00035E40FB|nr:hypothetical protein [Longispora albida]